MKDGLFDKGDLVSYGTNGICCIEDIRFMSFSSGAKKSMYYILKPEASGESTIFVPAENEKLVSKMRKLMTKEEIIDSVILKGMANEDRRVLINDLPSSNGYVKALKKMVG